MTDRGFQAAALVALVALGVGCERGAAEAPSDTGASSSSAGPATDEPIVPVRFDRTSAQLTTPDIDDAEVIEVDVWFAGTPAEWQQGLTGVTDLNGADGMLFAFEVAAEYQFYMWQTPMPLDIYYFDADGRSVGSDTMHPCLEGPSSRCARYSPGVPFLTALEVPAGSFPNETVDDSWTISFTAPVPAASVPATSSPGDG